MNTRILTPLIVTMTTSSCGWTPFQPVPPTDFLWTQEGKSYLDVKKALLECGLPHPAGSGNRPMTPNESASYGRCMLGAGYTYKYGTFRLICATQPSLNLPECRSDAPVPLPDINRRLNSGYCERKRSYAFCKKNAINPAACESMDFDNPPPECLP
ncbi:hypothetical protein [Paraburkholderia megapolitana]|nr:hypothetical protein [Paraburkholderia megapolitana]QDQ80791.1 hypothetical protein FNZ07_06170 [Paraburkholderia megapolitana]